MSKMPSSLQQDRSDVMDQSDAAGGMFMMADVSTQTPARLLDVKVDVAELFITTGNQHASYQSYAFLILSECF